MGNALDHTISFSSCLCISFVLYMGIKRTHFNCFGWIFIMPAVYLRRSSCELHNHACNGYIP